MTIDPADLTLYAGALLVLFLTPGPVWLALLARTLSGGYMSAMLLALGVVVGDCLWPLAAIHGSSWVVSVYSEILVVMRWVAAFLFAIFGLQLIWHANQAIQADGRLTTPGFWPGFSAGRVDNRKPLALPNQWDESQCEGGFGEGGTHRPIKSPTLNDLRPGSLEDG